MTLTIHTFIANSPQITDMGRSLDAPPPYPRNVALPDWGKLDIPWYPNEAGEQFGWEAVVTANYADETFSLSQLVQWDGKRLTYDAPVVTFGGTKELSLDEVRTIAQGGVWNKILNNMITAMAAHLVAPIEH